MAVTALLAGAPIAVVLVLMIALGRSAAVAGLAGLAVAIGIAVAVFGYGSVVRGDLGIPGALAAAGAEAAFAAATIVWVIWPALCIYELQRRTGAFDRLRSELSRLASDRATAAVLVAWFFALFMEGAAGFGTPIALAAPVLVGLGFPPVKPNFDRRLNVTPRPH